MLKSPMEITLRANARVGEGGQRCMLDLMLQREVVDLSGIGNCKSVVTEMIRYNNCQ
jgi:hypothetical protein